MVWRLRSIEALSDVIYRAVLVRGSEERSFTFNVDSSDGIDVLQSEPAFYEFIGLQRPDGQHLLAAVSAFHNARELTVHKT